MSPHPVLAPAALFWGVPRPVPRPGATASNLALCLALLGIRVTTPVEPLFQPEPIRVRFARVSVVGRFAVDAFEPQEVVHLRRSGTALRNRERDRRVHLFGRAIVGGQVEIARTRHRDEVEILEADLAGATTAADAVPGGGLVARQIRGSQEATVEEV